MVTDFVTSPLLNAAGFPHGFGTRRTPPGAFPSPLYTLAQVHGDRIIRLADPLPEKTYRFTEADALLTARPGVFIGVRTADCLPVLLADPAGGAVGAVHCGWRSLALGLAGKAVRELARLGGGRPEGFLAALGPSIRACCYEVGEEVAESFSLHPGGRGAFTRLEGRLFLDLAEAARMELLCEGINQENIEQTGGCSKCRPDLYHSFRGERTRERMVSFIGL